MLKKTIKEINIILKDDIKQVKFLQDELLKEITKENTKEIINDLFLCNQIIEEKERKIKALTEKEQIKETLEDN